MYGFTMTEEAMAGVGTFGKWDVLPSLRTARGAAVGAALVSQ